MSEFSLLDALQLGERIRDKSLDVLERYTRVREPKGVCDRLSYIFDVERQTKRKIIGDAMECEKYFSKIGTRRRR